MKQEYIPICSGLYSCFFIDQTDKPGSVLCGNLSTLIVANKFKPSLPCIRRADVEIHSTNRRSKICEHLPLMLKSKFFT